MELDAAVHWSSVKNEHVAGSPLQALTRDTEHTIVLSQRRDVAALHSLELEAQNVERFSPFDSHFDSIEDLHAELRYRAGQQRPRAAYANLGAELLEPPDVRPRDTRMEHVAADTDSPPFERSKVVAQRQQVEQPLRRML